MSQKCARGTLHEKTLALLKESGLTLVELHNLTSLPFYWLKKFSADEIADPSVNRVQALYEFLRERKLELN